MAADKLAGAYVNCSNNQGNVYHIVIGCVKVLLSGATCWRLAHSVVKGGSCYETSETGNVLLHFGPGIDLVFI